MGKRSRAKKQQNAVAEAQENPVEEDPDFEKENGVSVAWKGSEPDYADDDSGEFDFEKGEKMDSKSPEIKNTWLILGLLLAVAGLLGVIGLRTGFVQLLLGDPNPYPGIGSVEPMGHMVSIMPFVLGIVVVAFWGIKNDPIYQQIEDAGKPQEDSNGEDELGGPKEIIQDDSPEPEPEVDVAKAAPGVMLEQDGDIDGLEDPGQELAKEQEFMRIQRCEKMLGAVVVLPDDRKNLKKLIDQGISMEEFIEETKKAVERRKMKVQEKDITADEKAAILEDTLVAELGLLADELEDDNSSLEDQVMKELDDLEGL